MSDLKERLSGLSPVEQRTLLAERLRKKASKPRLAPASFAQERLWFLDQLEPGNPTYNMPAAVRLSGRLDVVALSRSLNEIMRRHETLRTTFRRAGELPVQAIAPFLLLDLPLIDLRQLASAQRETETRRLTTVEARRPFDLVAGPLLRARLLRLCDEEHVLFLNVHHVISDGWSQTVLLRELILFYQAFTIGRFPPLFQLPLQYADFAVWQRQWLQGEVLDAQISYWKQQLVGAPDVLELPADHPRPPVQTFRGARQSLLLSTALSTALTALSQREGVTLFVTLLAVFKTLLYRYTGRTDIIVGTPVAGRNRAEIEGLIGFFVNTLAIRTDLSHNPTFRELMGRVREVVMGAYAHQDLPFEMLVRELQPERNPSRTPLFQVMFVLQNTPSLPRELPDLTLGLLEVDSGTSGFDLTLLVTTVEQGLRITLEYNTDLLDAGTVVRMLCHLQSLLQGAVANPERRLGELPLLTKAERGQLLVAWNDTQTDYARHRCVHELFEAQAEQNPAAIAIVFQAKHHTYRNLNQRANQLAHHLQGLGVGPDTRVGLFVERSPEALVGLLGILKAGGAYVPLDPAYPKDRIRFMLQDAQVPVLLTQARAASALPDLNGVQVICLDTDWNVISQESKKNPASDVVAENLAYVIYTSGSTGTPKGVLVEHRSLVNLVQAANTEYELRARDRVLQFASLSFDAAAEEIFSCLLSGGTLVLRSEEMLDSVSGLVQACCDLNLTVLDLPTAFWHYLTSELAAAELELPQSLRLVIIGGERALPECAKLWQTRVGERPLLVNTFGPTETTVVATYFKLPPSTLAYTARGEMPIGRPICNTQVYVLDPCLQPTPIGVPGELYIGGAGLARGYLYRPARTAERFIPNPFPPPGGDGQKLRGRTRLYKTGDLVRYRPDGNIEFLGRLDHQVKVRGFRVEPDEVASILRKHPQVRETVVLAQDSSSGNKRLVAYVVPTGKRSDTQDRGAVSRPSSFVAELRDYLKRKLPNYMLPSALVTLQALPLTPNGKVDRRALPEPERDRADPETFYMAPRTPVEQILSGIWAQILDLEQVSIYDDFFDLGGHSLLATQVISRVRDAFQLELPLRELFAAPTVVALAGRIEQVRRTQRGPTALPLRSVPRDRDLPLSFAQQRLWFLDQLEPGSAAYNIPVAVHLSGQLDVSALAHSLNKIVRRHEALRTTFASRDGQARQVIDPALRLTLAQVDLKALPEAERQAQVQRLAAGEAQRSFDLIHGPLVRATLLHLGERENVLLLTMHHIVSDGWSIGVLVRELAALYQAFVVGKPSRQAGDKQSPLPKFPIQYADYAVWQREWLHGEVLEAQLTHWKECLAGDLPVLELPTDRPRPPVQTFHGARQSWAWSRSPSQALKTLSQREGVTMFMTLLAAFQVLLHRYTGQTDLVVGSPVAGRNRTELEDLIGFFVNTLALRANLSGNPTFRELLHRVRETMVGAYAHQDLPFEKLVEELQLARDLSHNPLFQVMFALQNAPMPALELPDLTLTPLETDSGTARFDLTVSVWDTSQGLRGMWEYNTDLFDAGTMERMQGHFQTLLERIVANEKGVEQSLSDLSSLTDIERQQLLVQWNDTGTAYCEDKCIYELFEAQAKQTPDAVAIVSKDGCLSYDALNRRANQLAHHLRELGARSEELVGVFMERSLEMLVGLWGVLKAGSVYIPLEPAYPQERLAFMLEDTQAPILLTQRHLLDKLPAHQAQVVCLDSDWGTICTRPQTTPPRATAADNLAYTIYTSGSTGRPKGVQVLHGAVVNFVAAMRRRPGLTAQDVILSVTTLSFDIAVLELFLPLSVGARVVLVERAVAADGVQLMETLAASEATVMQATPATWQLLLAAGWQGDGQLRVLCGGEAFPRELAHHLLARAGSVWNLYGPTETTVWSTAHELTVLEDLIPIGRPIANTEVYLLDPYLQPVPIGVPGELYIGGAGLARGYLHRPGLSAQRFVPDPFPPPGGDGQKPKGGARLYRTGDLARYRPDGNIEFLGRADYQVKLRGFRIELGEIEALLSAHPQVKESVVLLREDAPGDKRLVVYLIAAQRPAPTVSELRHFLHERLPEYMIPSAFVTLDALPLTPNGKVDRRALPAPEGAGLDLGQTPVAPRDALELRLAHIWEQVLGVQPVGVTHSFFELGGHSLLAVRLLARIRQELGQELPLAVLFSSPTVECLAALLRQCGGGRLPFAALVPLQAGQPDRRPLFLVHPGGGNVFCYADLVRHLGVEQPCYGLQARGLDEKQVPHSGVEAMASYYLEWVRAVQAEGPYQLGGWSVGGVIAFEMAQQLRNQGQEVALLALIDSHAPASAEPEPDDVTLLGGFALDLGLPLQRLRLDPDYLATLGADERLTWILKEAQRTQVLPGDVGLAQVRRLFHIFKYNVQAVRQYVPRAYAGPAMLFKAQEQRGDFEPDLGWRAVAGGGLAVQTVPGDHYAIVREPHVAVLAGHIQRRLCVQKEGK